jgi:hypothetical protein
VGVLQSGVDETTVARMLIASGEYQSAHADNSSYVAGLYQDVLARTASANEIAGWTQALSGASRDAVAAAFLTSQEAYLGMLDFDYTHFLHRGVDAAGQQFWLSQLLSSQISPRGVSLAILASEEFFAQAETASQS